MDHPTPTKTGSASSKPVERIFFPAHVPYYAQVASPDWAEAVFDRGLDPSGDLRWPEWDACDAQEYAAWCPRACGAVCVKMCVEALGGPVIPVMGWIRQGLALDGYEIKTSPEGVVTEIGWKHAALVQLIDSSGLHAAALPMDLSSIPIQLSNSRLIVASVSYEIGTDRPVTHRGGHLVVVTGAELREDRLRFLYVNNPSGRTPALRECARIPISRFSQAYSGRVIAVSDRPFRPA
jgi:hypothetical protein